MSNQNPVPHRHMNTRWQYAKRTNYLFYFLLLLAFLLGLIAVGMIVLLILVSRFNLPLLDYLPGLDSLPPQSQVFTVSAILLAAALFLLILARWRLVANPSFQFMNGCPSCRHHDLIRVHRHGYQRLLAAFFRVPLRSYACRNCKWQGALIYRLPKPSISEELLAQSTVLDSAEGPTDTPALDHAALAAAYPVLDNALQSPAGPEPQVPEPEVHEPFEATTMGEASVAAPPTPAVELYQAAEPEPAEEPYHAAEPEYAVEPESAAEPYHAAEPEYAAEPDLAEEPYHAAEPEYAAEPEPAEEPYHAAEPGLTEAPAHAVEEVAAVSPPAPVPVEETVAELPTGEETHEPPPGDSHIADAPEVAAARRTLVDPLMMRETASLSDEPSARAVIVAPFGLTMRSEPSRDAPEILTLEPDTIVEMLDRDDSHTPASWRQVKYEGKIGWVSAAFLRHLQS